jgi:hypothetical protein
MSQTHGAQAEGKGQIETKRHVMSLAGVKGHLIFSAMLLCEDRPVLLVASKALEAQRCFLQFP